MRWFRPLARSNQETRSDSSVSMGNARTPYFRVEYFNIFNHPMFAPPSANFNNLFPGSGFGTITSTLNDFLSGGPGTLSPLYQIGGPRSGQLTLKLVF